VPKLDPKLVKNKEPVPFVELAHLKTNITMQRLNEMIDEDGTFDVLNNKESVIGPVLIEKCDLEMKKLLSGEMGNFHDFFELLRSLSIKVNEQENKSFRRQLEMKSSNELIYILSVIEKPSKISRLFNSELSRLCKTEEAADLKASRISNFMNLNSLILETLETYKGVRFHLEVQDSLILQLATLFTSTQRNYEFFKNLIKLNSTNTISSSKLSLVRSRLRNGTEEERKLFNFYELFEGEENEITKSNFIHLYSFKLIRQILVNHIQQNDQYRSKVYMDLLVSRFSIEAASLAHNSPKNTIVMKKLTENLYNSLMYYSTKLGNYKSSLAILQKMVANNVEITPKLCHILITSLRKKKLYQGSLSLFRILPKFFSTREAPADRDKMIFINELITLLREKFNDPRLVLAHLITIFPHSRNLMNSLKLINPIMNSESGEFNNVASLNKAVLNDFFVMKGENSYPSITIMTELYMSLFNAVSNGANSNHTLNNPQFYKELFDSFISVATKVQAEEGKFPAMKNHPFSSKNLDEGILNIFLRRVLEDHRKPALALTFTKRYLSDLKLKRFDASKLVHIFYRHPDHSGTSYNDMVTILKYFKVDLSFQLIVANIFKSFNRGDVELAENWYEILLEKDFTLINRRFIKFIHHTGWGFPKSFNYKLLEYLELSNNQQETDEFSMYSEDENLETFDDKFVEELIEELNNIHQRDTETSKNET
jgi:hypothetical protein